MHGCSASTGVILRDIGARQLGARQWDDVAMGVSKVSRCTCTDAAFGGRNAFRAQHALRQHSQATRTSHVRRSATAQKSKTWCATHWCAAMGLSEDIGIVSKVTRSPCTDPAFERRNVFWEQRAL